MKVEISDIDSFGRGITKINGKICFVKDALPGEVVDTTIIKEKKNYSEAIIKDYIIKRDDRIEACPVQDICGGCDILHFPEELKRQFKIDKVKNALKLKDVELVSMDSFHYRNKVIFHIDKNNLGFYEKKTNRLVSINQCLLVDKKINLLLPLLKEIVKQNDCTEIMVRTDNHTNEVLISIKGSIKRDDIKELSKHCDVLSINEKQMTKKDKIKSIIKDKEYLVSKDSFFQINSQITEELYTEIKQIVKEKKPKKVLDLYCGTGTIGIFIANEVEFVLAIELQASSIRDAKENKKLNKVDNIEFYQGDVKDYVDMIKDSVDMVIVDPPRAGINKELIQKLLQMNIKNIVYISCDLYTLKRDLDLLSDKYNVDSVKAYDMFPNTHHVETVALLTRIKKM